MSFLKGIFLTHLILGIISGILWNYGHLLLPEGKLLPLKNHWWAKENKDKFVSDDKIYEFKIEVNDKVLEDLKTRLENARFGETLENVNFQYGFNSKYLKDITDYWKNKYNWRKQEKLLNQFAGYKTQIDGINIHFIHIKPKSVPTDKKVIPLLLIHGWPGSVFEFYKIIPTLTTIRENSSFVFEVICPHIPGYGFSEAPHREGFGPKEAASSFDKLMHRLGFNNYYVQGGDWGSFIGSFMALYFPKKVKGLHINFAQIGTTGQYIKAGIGSLYPSLFVDDKDYKKLYPMKDKIKFTLRESGYLHIQATKPDTVGTGLNDSPIGLAAYILEKFSTWVNPAYLDLADGGLTKKFTLDELLTNVMIYWVTGSITSSVRFYRECFQQYQFEIMPKHFITVPSAIASFPQEILNLPEFLAHHQYSNLIQYTDMPKGGHFAAFEEPNLLADDIFSFVEKVENLKL